MISPCANIRVSIYSRPVLHVDSGHQASPVFTIILSYLNIAHTLLVQPIGFIKASPACILEGLHTDVYHLYTIHLLLSKTNSGLLSHTLLWLMFSVDHKSLYFVRNGRGFKMDDLIVHKHTLLMRSAFSFLDKPNIISRTHMIF